MLKSKKSLREDMLAKRKQMSEACCQELALQISERIIDHPLWEQYEQIALYAPIQREVDTRPLLAKAREEHKDVYFPKTNPQDQHMHFYRVQSSADLIPGHYGIAEPDPERCERWSEDSPLLLFVPALVFDRAGYRIGYGGGYYDRFLQKQQAVTGLSAAGIAYSFQLIKAHFLPREAFDMPVDFIFTPEEDLDCRLVRAGW